MVTQEQIEAKNFTFYKTHPESLNNPIASTEYLAIGTRTLGNPDRIGLISLIYFDDSSMKITNFFNNPAYTKEYFFIGDVEDSNDLDDAVTSIDFAVTVLDLADINDYT
ncbi:MAG: hypothetical protein ACSLE0_23265 [Chitinophagaceae bacterium]